MISVAVLQSSDEDPMVGCVDVSFAIAGDRIALSGYENSADLGT